MSLRFTLAAAIVGIAAVSASAGNPSFSVTGKWTSDFGLMDVTESDSKVTGTYAFENGKIIGTRSGNQVTIRWIQSTSSRKCDTSVEGSHFHGRAVLDFTANEFVGKWAYCDDTPADQWSGKREMPKAPSPPWVARSLADNLLPLAGETKTWSDPKLFVRANAQLTVQSRFLEQHGTTCKFEVQFNNVGAKAMDESIIVGRPGKAAVSNYDFPLRAKLAPGTSVAYGTEIRECPGKWGKSQDMAKCASCEPTVYFVGQ